MGASPGRRTARRLVVAGISVALLGGTALQTDLAYAAKDPAAITIPQRYLDQQVEWRPCDFDGFFRSIEPAFPTTLCTKILVPMDWRRPDKHPDIRLAIAHSAATGKSKGLLTSNPGGPGAAGLDFTAALSLSKTRMFTDYDLLGFDPRGFGESENANCYATEAELAALPEVPDHRIRNKATHAAEVAEARLLGKACARTELSQFVSTQQTVHDLEFLRRYLGKGKPSYDKLNYIGYSYGTWLGTWYADTYPKRVGRFVLDSNMNWTSTMYANQATDSYSFQRRRDKMFFPWLARQHQTYGLGNTSAKVSRSYERIRAALLKAYQRGEFVPSPSDMDYAIAVQLYANWQFPGAGDTLLDFQFFAEGNADAGTRRRLAAAVKSPGDLAVAGRAARRAGAPAGELIDIGPGYDIVRCNDSRYPRDRAAVLKRADSDAKKYPFIGYLNTLGMCNYWKFAPTTRTINLAKVPKMLMIQSEGDPATAYEGAKVAYKRTAAHTRLVSVDNEGQHGLYVDGPSPCVEAAGDNFLFRGRLPSKNMVCTTTPLPLDSRVYSLKGPLNGKSYPTEARVRSAKLSRANQVLREVRADAARLGAP